MARRPTYTDRFPLSAQGDHGRYVEMNRKAVCRKVFKAKVWRPRCGSGYQKRFGNDGSCAARPKGNNSFYKYSTSSDTWIKETDYPTDFTDDERVGPSSLVIGEKVYIACGATNTGMKQFHSYHPASRSWGKLADFPQARHGTTVFGYGGFGFVATGIAIGSGGEHDCFPYDVAADRWESLPDRIGPQPVGAPTVIESGYSFVVNGKAFVGGGDSLNGINKLFMIDLPVLLGSGD